MSSGRKDRSKLKMSSLLPPTLGSVSHVNMTIPQSFNTVTGDEDTSKSDMWAPIMDREDNKLNMTAPAASRWDTDITDIPSPKNNHSSMGPSLPKDRTLGQKEHLTSDLRSLFSKTYDSKPADSTTAEISKENSNKKIRHRSESTSTSSSESSDDDLKSSSSKEMDTKQTLVNKKASLLKSMKMLIEQKSCLDNQRDEITRNDASNEENSYLLEENSNLNTEITKQIQNMCLLISEINNSIEDYEKQSDQKKGKSKKKKKKSKKKHKKEKRHKESSSETEEKSPSKLDGSITDKMLEEKLKEMKPQGTTVVPGGVVLAPRYWDIVKPLPNAEEQQKEENSRTGKDFGSDNQSSYYHPNRRSYGNERQYGRGTGRYDSYDKRNYDYDNRRGYEYDDKRGYDYEAKRNYDYDDKRNDDYRNSKSNRSSSRRRSESPSEEMLKEVKTSKKSLVPLINVDEMLEDHKKDKVKEMKQQQPNLVTQLVNKEMEKLKEVKVKEEPKTSFIDQGMHWCSTCITFVETLELYVKHLASPVHLSALKKKKKLLLPPVESGEKVNEAALARPLQGLEFIEAGFTYYCQLCDVLLRRAEQIQIHMHSDTHIEAYKNHNLEKPLYESSYMKDKMNAYAKFMINHQEEKSQEQKPLTASNDKAKAGSFLDETFACDSVFADDAEETKSDKNVVSSSSFTKDSEYAREGACQVDLEQTRDSNTPDENSQKLFAELSRTPQSIRVTARKMEKSDRMEENRGWRERSPPKQPPREVPDSRERKTRGDARVRSKRTISPRRNRSPEVFENNKLIEELKKKAALRIQEKREAELMREKLMAKNREEDEKEAQRKLEEKLEKFSRRKSVVEEKKTHSRFPLIGKMPFFKSKPASLKSSEAKQDAESGIASPQQQQLEELQQKIQEHQLHLQQQKLTSNEAAMSADESRHSSCTLGSRDVSEDRRMTDTPETSLTTSRVTKEGQDSDFNGSYDVVMEEEASLPMDIEDSPSNSPLPPDVPPPPVDETTPPPPPPLPPTTETSSSSAPTLPPSIDIPLPTIETPQTAPIISADIVRIREELKGGKMEGLPPYYPTTSTISSTSSSYMQHNSAYGYHPSVAAAHTYYNNGSSGGYDMMGMYTQDYNTPPPPLFSHPPPPIPSTEEGNGGEDGDPPPPGAEDDELLPPGVEMGDVTKEAEREEVDVLMNSLLTKDQIEAKLKETGQLSP